jgi:transcriptional regulator of arginine metabolism
LKDSRQSVILQIISEREIETQAQLIEALAERGIPSTQATLSRDIKQLHLIKELGSSGKYHYVVSGKSHNNDRDIRLRKIFRESVTSYAVAQNIIVIKTLPGLASAACSTLDSMHIETLAGTLAGDDTAFLAMKDNEAAEQFCHDIDEML